MDTEQPPLKCAECGQPINTGESYTAINPEDPETGETTMIGAHVVHEDCLSEWTAAHPGRSN